MNSPFENPEDRIIHDPTYNCPVCGAKRYVTDHGNHELTLHCSSPEARFWDFERGSVEQTDAKQHWDQSKQEVFLSVEDVIRFMTENECRPAIIPVTGRQNNAAGG